MFKSFSAIRGYLLFWLTFFAMIVCAVYAYYKNDKGPLDMLPILLGIYATHSASKQISAHINARMDTDADAEKVIADTKES